MIICTLTQVLGSIINSFIFHQAQQIDFLSDSDCREFQLKLIERHAGGLKRIIMKKNRCIVVLHYDPQDAKTHQKVVACITRLDPNAAGLFEKNTFSGRMVLKRDTDPETARRLKKLFDTTGAACDIRNLPDKPPAGLVEEPKASEPSASGDQASPRPLIQCPKCGCEQPAGLECHACGVIISKARPHNPFQVIENPDPPPSRSSAPPRLLARMRRWMRPILALVEKIQHPINVKKLTTWSQRVADRMVRCGLVFVIALILETAMLFLGKMLWSLYVATSMGQYYVEKLPEQAQMFQRIVDADPLSLGLDVTLVVLGVSLVVGCAAQILHLIRCLYESQGILVKLILWFIPCMGLTAWILNQRHPYPELALAGSLSIVPTLCMLSSSLYLARIILPELGDLRAIVSIIMKNRDAAWALIIKKIRIWFETTKRVS
jgi:hypothetical protein